MKRLLIVGLAGLFLVLAACGNTHVNQSACVTNCQANSHPTPSYPVYSAAPQIYYRPQTVNCVPVGYPPVVHCGYAPY